MKFIWMISLFSTLLFSDFIKDNGTVIDETRHLQWDDTNKRYLQWQNSIAYCENLVLDQQDDWRLPNINELFTITNHSNINALDYEFTTLIRTKYWSSTSSIMDHERAWFIEFNSKGLSGKTGKTIKYAVRCVRTTD